MSYHSLETINEEGFLPVKNHRLLSMFVLGLTFIVLFLVTGTRRSVSAQAVSGGWSNAFYTSLSAKGDAPDSILPRRPLDLSAYSSFTSITYNPAIPPANSLMTINVHVVAQCTTTCPTPLIGNVILKYTQNTTTKSLGTKALSFGLASYFFTPKAGCYTFEADYPGVVTNGITFFGSGTAKQTCFR
jgi:hypothetical protein